MKLKPLFDIERFNFYHLWKKMGNPGNLLYFHECLIKLIDGVWLQIQTGHLKIKDPLLPVQSFLNSKGFMNGKWKWRYCSLNNVYRYGAENRNQIELCFNYTYLFSHFSTVKNQPV